VTPLPGFNDPVGRFADNMVPMRGYEVRVAVDLDQAEKAARLSGRDIDDLLNEFAQRLQETAERLVESWSGNPSHSARPVLPSGHEIVEIPDSSQAS
jgi:hypothetical protein